MKSTTPRAEEKRSRCPLNARDFSSRVAAERYAALMDALTEISQARDSNDYILRIGKMAGKLRLYSENGECRCRFEALRDVLSWMGEMV